MGHRVTASGRATSQGVTYYWTAWMPNASGLPGHEWIAGRRDDQRLHFGTMCSGNVGVLQLDTFSWSSPRRSHYQGQLHGFVWDVREALPMLRPDGTDTSTSADSVGNAGTWKNRVPFSKGGNALCSSGKTDFRRRTVGP